MGRNVTCPHLGTLNRREERWPKHKWLLRSEDHGDSAEQPSEFKALHEYECATDESYSPGLEKYINIQTDLLQHVQMSQSCKPSVPHRVSHPVPISESPWASACVE